MGSLLGLYLLKQPPPVDAFDLLDRALNLLGQPLPVAASPEPSVEPTPDASGPLPSTFSPSAADIGPEQRFQLARNAGWSPEDAVIMAAISLFECASCDMHSVNASGDVSLWQINRVHWSRTGGPDVLVDPRESARAAMQVWSGVGGGEAGFRQW